MVKPMIRNAILLACALLSGWVLLGPTAQANDIQGYFQGPHGAFAARRVWRGAHGVYSRGVIGRN
jgi:hypothetical protein